MRRTQTLRRVRGLVVVPVLLVLTACVSIPESGSVTTRTAEAHAQRVQGFIHAFAPPATAGMTMPQIARGFLLAQVDSDHTAALSYLTADEAERWNTPDPQITIFANEDEPTWKSVTGGWQFTAAEAGVVSAEGDFTATPGQTATGRLRMSRVDGEWRIASAPDGLFLSPDDFARNYTVYDTFFVDSASRMLVPNPVYVPVGSSQSTSLVKALLAGPAPWLAPAVRSAFPPGTRLAPQSAPVHDNVVHVDLSQQVLLASDADKRLLGAQLAWTLGQLDDVNAVRVTVGDVPLAGLAQQIDRNTPDSLNPSGANVGPAVAIVNGHVATLGKIPVDLAGAIGSGVTPLVQPAISPLGDRAAALDKKATKLFVGTVRFGGALKVRLQAKSLVSPSFDPFGDVWTAGIGKTGPAIWVVSGGGAARQVVAPELGQRSVLALRIARDGVRAALVIESKKTVDKKVVKERDLFVGHVVRTATDIRLDGLHRVESVLADVADVAWASDDGILVLGASPGGGVQPYLVKPFGVVVPTGGPLKDITDVTAAPQQVILAATSKGKIWSTDGTDGWQLVRTVHKGADPSYPG
jgi:hypothetical protein